MQPKWVGEVAYTTSTAATRMNLTRLVSDQTTIDFAFVLAIDELPEWKSPRRHPTHLPLSLDQFISQVTLLGQGGGCVVLDGITWMSITSITIECYLRRPEGQLTIDNNVQDEFSVVGTLYPIIATQQVDQMLLRASGRIKEALLTEIAGNSSDDLAIQQVEGSQANVVIPWQRVMGELRRKMLLAAYVRYCDWHGV